MTPETPQPLPMASTGCACCTPASDQTAPAAEAAPSAGTSATYQVEGMTCGHCAGRVTEALTALEGVLDVQIDLVAGEASAVTVTSTTPVAEESVRAAVARAGYAVTSS
ncbi:heavy-metal-associated domain-containing protein [Kocuria sp. PD6]|uniref:heavy-metal-associated domain-containing protein n=1 Tax=Kocuria sp. PD6 TaxID=2962590 RepID=UPI0028826FDB|nr:heavy-metal-associated domain-containing protein [Kocuria sp. PD6]MDT0119045.1 heavy-metal-associated domain-containing protein [Kocuria sp. PD6]